MADSTRPRFHLAMPVDDLDAARAFYGETLGCAPGRSADTWVDWDFRGHQIVTHLSPVANERIHNPVDGHDVPVPHFGLILEIDAFHELAERLRAARRRASASFSRPLTSISRPSASVRPVPGYSSSRMCASPEVWASNGRC